MSIERFEDEENLTPQLQTDMILSADLPQEIKSALLKLIHGNHPAIILSYDAPLPDLSHIGLFVENIAYRDKSPTSERLKKASEPLIMKTAEENA